MYDELQLDTLGDKKTALFLIMSDTDSTFNFLISMVYTQLFNLLCDKADDVYGGKLPIHVRCLIDECANIGQIPNLEKLVATIRSREISACLVLQARSQLKAIYKDNADTIVGNMDSQIFLGGSEPTTLKDLSEMLGKETIDAFNTSDTRGNSPSYGTTFQKMGHELLSRDELAVLDGGKCILQLRGVRPFLSDKYDLTQHPNYKLTSDYDPKNTFDIEKYLNRKEEKSTPVMSSSWWTLIRSRLPDPVGGFIFTRTREVHQQIHFCRSSWLKNIQFQVCTDGLQFFQNKGETTMEFFNSAIEVLQTLVVALGAGLGVWGAINLLEGYGNDNPLSFFLSRCSELDLQWQEKHREDSVHRRSG